MNLRRTALFAAALFGLAAAASAAFEPEPSPSTGPIGGAFYRHLAHDFGLDIRELVKLERRGFGRGEVVTIVLISKATGTGFKDYAKRRLKDKVLLKDLAAEAGLDYPTLLKNVRAIKEGIEAKGDAHLPPPVYEPSPTPQPGKRKPKADSTPDPKRPAPAPAPVTDAPAAPIPESVEPNP